MSDKKPTYEELEQQVAELKKSEIVCKSRAYLLELSKTESYSGLLQQTLDKLEDLTNSDVGFFHFLGEDQKTLSLQAWSTNTIMTMCKTDVAEKVYNLDQAGVWVDCVRLRRPVVHNDYESLSHKKGMPEGHAPITRELVVPVFRSDKIVAILGVGNKPDDYIDEDVDIVAHLADMVWDITERMKAEEVLRKSMEENKFLASIIEHSTQPFAVGYTDGSLGKVNKAFCDFVGYAEEELFNMDWINDLTPQDWREKERQNVEEVIRTGEPSLYEKEYIHKDGTRIPAETLVQVEKNEEGDVVCLYGFVTDITERKKAEEALLESNTRHSAMIENIGDVIGVMGIDGIVKYKSPNIERYFGWKPDDLVGTDGWETVHPEDIERIQKEFYALIEKDNALTKVVYRYKCKDGTYKWIELIAVNCLNNPAINGVLLNYHDISERKNTEETLRESEERYRLINDASLDQIYSYDLENRFTSANRQLCANLGRTADEVVGKSYWELGFPESNCREWDELHRKVYATGSNVEIVSTPMPDGTTHYFEVNLSLVHDDAGEVIGIAGVNRDITDKREADERIRNSEAQLRLIIDSSPAFIAYADIDTLCYKYANKRMQEGFGLSENDFYDKPIVDVIGEDNYKYALKYIDEVRNGKSTSYENHFKLEKGDRFVQVNYVPHVDEKGSVKGIVVMSHDITERKKAEDSQQRFQEQEKHAVVGKVAGKMAHDFNNILGIIMGTSQLMQSNDIPQEMQADIEIILESAKKGRDLTKNLLFFSKDQDTKLSQFDLREKIDMVIRSLKSELRDVEVNTSYGSGMDKLLADAGLLENALINMVQNSIHAMSKTKFPKLNIKTYAENNNICIEIEDNGCGIPEEWKDKIYDPTVSLKGSGDRTGAYSSGIKGSGYGMANVKRCVDKHGGTISFTSEVDKGTKFKITLPLIEGHFSNEEIETIQKQHAVGEKRILIVEDEPHFGRILYSLLEKFNHNVALATDGKMALNHIEHNTYDAISLDYILPDMTGMDVYRKIRETNKEIPVIFVSGNFEFMQSMIDLKKEDPNVDYLAKPFDNVEYVNKLHQWLPEKG